MAKPRNSSKTPQLGLDFEKPCNQLRGKFSLATAGLEGMRCLPLMALLALLAQVGIRGLRPALAERRELQRKDVELDELYSAALDERHELELRIRAQDDPIYIERMRRLRVREQLGETSSQ